MIDRKWEIPILSSAAAVSANANIPPSEAHVAAALSYIILVLWNLRYFPVAGSKANGDPQIGGGIPLTAEKKTCKL